MRSSWVLMLVAALGCSGKTRGSGDDGGLGGSDLGLSGDTCTAQAKLVYLVDTNNMLSSFAPDTLTFTDVGALACPAQLFATPFSMAVDRSAVAWVLYSSGELFRYDTQAKTCQSTSFAKSNGFGNFGMGFSSDASGSSTETLFIAGGAANMVTTGTSRLATLDLGTMTATVLGSIALWPELTGTGAAELWGFFPAAGTPRVAQLDKMTGADLKSFPAATLSGTPKAWAFAFWGGDFWIFLQRQGEASTSVYRMHGTTGVLDTVIPQSGRHIVGAGVSTCAPVIIQ